MQKEIFKRQIKLACEIQKPLLIHERSAQNDVMEILSRSVCALEKELLAMCNIIIIQFKIFFIAFRNQNYRREL